MSEIDYDGLWKQYVKYTKAYIFDRFKESNQSYILERQAHLQTKKELEELQDAVREWDENPTALRRSCIRTAIEASRQRNKPKGI